MSRRGYGFERETECFLCALFEQNVHEDFSQRSFRTATSGAATSSKGDVRTLNTAWLDPITFECKHLNDWSSKGATFHLYVEWVKKIAEEAKANKSDPALTWAFKNARTHRGEGRVQFCVPTHVFHKWLAAADYPKVTLLQDQVKYVEKKAKFFLAYHDELWEKAKDPDQITLFEVIMPEETVFGKEWVIVSRRHLQKVLEAIRAKWKGNANGTSGQSASQ